MPRNDGFVDHVLDLLAPIGAVSARRMFGGYGIYHNQRMFALIADDMLYFKVDDTTRPEFAARDLRPFRYRRQGRMTEMSYCQAPPEALDDSGAMCVWARRALAAIPARRARRTGAVRR